MLEYAYGNMAMLDIDISKFDYYSSLSALQKSKYNLLNNATFVGNNFVHPMNYAGEVRVWYGTTLEIMFGTNKASSSYKTPMEAFNDTYNSVNQNWDNWIAKAGVSN